jgi:hypothetical protein
MGWAWGSPSSDAARTGVFEDVNQLPRRQSQMHLFKWRLSPSFVLAFAALWVALAGTAVANVIITSPDQMANGVVTGPKIAKDAVASSQIVPRSILQEDERNPTLRARVASSGKIITGDVPGGFAGHVPGSNRYDVPFSAGDLGPLGLDECAVAVSPEFDFDQSEGHRQLRAYANLAKGAKQVNVFTYEQRIVNGQLIERPTEAAFDLVLGC